MIYSAGEREGEERRKVRRGEGEEEGVGGGGQWPLEKYVTSGRSCVLSFLFSRSGTL